MSKKTGDPTTSNEARQITELQQLVTNHVSSDSNCADNSIMTVNELCNLQRFKNRSPVNTLLLLICLPLSLLIIVVRVTLLVVFASIDALIDRWEPTVDKWIKSL